jgi:hypothetical protein
MTPTNYWKVRYEYTIKDSAKIRCHKGEHAYIMLVNFGTKAIYLINGWCSVGSDGRHAARGGMNASSIGITRLQKKDQHIDVVVMFHLQKISVNKV